MKLLYITNGINGSGGLERVLSVKASLLAEEHGYEVTILSLNGAHLNLFYEFSSKIKMLSIPVSGNPVQYFLQYKKGIQKIVNELQPDIISVCDDGLKGFFVPTIIKTKAKIIYERHASINLNTDSSFKGKIIQKLMRRQVSKFHRFVVLTPSNIQEWQGNNVIAIANPLSFYPEEESSLQNKKVIVVGSHSYNKGYDLLLDAWQNVEKQHPDWELNIYGKIDIEETYVYYSKQLGLQKVNFHHPVPDIQAKYLESSFLVLSSRSEGFGMVLIEAMACAVPCVSFDCPSGPADIITDGEDGFLVEKENVPQLAEKITLLIENKELRQQMGAKAKENVKRYLPENIVRQWDVLFKELTS